MATNKTELKKPTSEIQKAENLETAKVAKYNLDKEKGSRWKSRVAIKK